MSSLTDEEMFNCSKTYYEYTFQDYIKLAFVIIFLPLLLLLFLLFGFSVWLTFHSGCVKNCLESCDTEQTNKSC